MAGKIKIDLSIPGLRQAKEDLVKLNEEIEKTQDVKESQKLVKQYNDLSKAIDKTTDELLEMNKAGQLVGTKFDDLNEVLFGTQQEVLPLTSQIGEMEDRLYQLVKAGETSGEEFKALQKEIVKNRQVIRETDKQIDLLAENQGLAIFAEGWSQVGASMLTLNFEQAAKDASALQGAVGNLGQIGASSLKSLGSTVKTLGATFLQFGKALLLNPIFLMSAAIAAIVFGVYKLLDALGFIQPVLDAIGAAIGWVVDGFKSLTDWLGITNHAEEEAAAEAKQRHQERMMQIESEAAARQRAFDARVNEINREIALLDAQGKGTFELRKEVINLEIAQIKQAETARAEMLKSFEALAAIDKNMSATVEKIKDETFKYAERTKDLENELKILEINNNKEKAASAKEYNDNRKQYAQDRLNALRLIEDLEVEMMKKGIDRELKENELKYQRLIEDTKKDENLTREEKEKIAKYYDGIRIQQEDKIRQGYLDKEKEKLKKVAELQKKANEDWLAEEEELSEIIRQAALTDSQLEIEAIEDKYFNLIERARQHGLDTIELEKQKNKELSAIDKKRTDEQLANEKAVQDAKFQMANDALNLISSAAELFGKKNEKSAKRAFEVNKAAQIAQAIMQTYQAAQGAYASQLSIPSPDAPIRASIAAGIAVANGLVNVAKIAQTKFESKSVTGGGGSSSPSIGGAGASVSGGAPSFNLFGQGNALDEAKSAKSQEMTQQIEVKAVVSETEVTNTQKKINNITKSAEL